MIGASVGVPGRAVRRALPSWLSELVGDPKQPLAIGRANALMPLCMKFLRDIPACSLFLYWPLWRLDCAGSLTIADVFVFLGIPHSVAVGVA